MAKRLYSVVALIRDESGRFLVVSRKDDHEDLGFPGGRIEDGESPEQAIVREVTEETGLAVSRRNLRAALVATDEKGRLCKAFDVSSYKGVPQSLEGAWVGWVEPPRLIDDRNTFKDYNLKVLELKGIPFDVDAPEPEPEGLSLEDALLELTGMPAFPQHHITFLYGPCAMSLCPETSMHQPRLTFDRRQFVGLLREQTFWIRTHLQPSLVPLNLFRFINSLGERCVSAVVAVSPHRPPADWEMVSSNILECVPESNAVRVTLMKNLATDGRYLIGRSVLVSPQV